MKFFISIVSAVFFISGCATNNNEKEVPIHAITIGMTKQEVASNLGKPHRIVANEMVDGRNQQTWMYQQDKVVWVTGNAFLGGRVRNDQVIYLLVFSDDKLVGWKDNAYQANTKPENTYELRDR